MEVKSLKENSYDEKYLKDIAKCHKKAFSNQFLSRMGVPALIGFYRENFIHNAIICVAYEKDQLAGFVSGGTEEILHQYRRKISHKYPFKFLFSLFSMEVVQSAMRIIFRTFVRSEGLSRKVIPANYYYLSVIAVHEDFKGKNVAGKLVDMFEKECLTRKYAGYYLNVSSANKRAIAFYKKQNMNVLACNETTTVMGKTLV